MKRILLATALGLGVITFTMAGGTHATSPVNITTDSVPSDTTNPTPAPDTTSSTGTH